MPILPFTEAALPAVELPSSAAPPVHRASLLDDPSEWPMFGRVCVGSDEQAVRGTVWESYVALEGMYCATCALTIEEALHAVPGVLSAEVSAASQRGKVTWNAAHTVPSQWMDAVNCAGYRAIPACDASARALQQGLQRKALWQWLLATFCMMQVMMYAWPAYDAQPGDLWAEHEHLLRWASWVICIPLLIFACGPFFSRAWRDLRQRRVGMDLPVALGMFITFAVSSVGTFYPDGVWGQEVFYDSLAMFVCFLLTGRWLEVRLRARTAGALDAILNRLPDGIEKLQSNGEFARVALRHLVCGDVVRVLPGEAFPGDGVIADGHTQVDEALLTGESRPLTRTVGDRVIAGSYNLNAAVQVRLEQVGADTQFAQIVELMESARIQKPRLAQLADRVAGPFLVVVMVLAAAAGLFWWPLDPERALMIAAAVLIVTCPCALSLATPVAMLTAAGTLARQGVLVRNLQALEALAQVDTVVFDKTGTLTHDGMGVQHFQSITDGGDAKWQALGAAIAQHSRHPVSQAVATFASSNPQAWTVLSVQECGGQGLRAQLRCNAGGAEHVGADVHKAQGAERVFRLGSRRFAGNGQGPADGRVPEQAVFLAEEVSPDTTCCVAYWVLQEGLRPHAREVVHALQSMHIQVQLLSGDDAAAVGHVAQLVGISQWYPRCAPQDKLTHLRAAQAAGRRVAMVGDGLNDGPVLAGAQVAFAFGRAVPLAQARSDFVVLGEDLSLVTESVRTARRTLRIVRQNLVGAALYNAASIPLAMAGWMPAWLAGLGMALSSLLVVLNAARLSRPARASSGVDGLQLRASDVSLSAQPVVAKAM